MYHGCFQELFDVVEPEHEDAVVGEMVLLGLGENIGEVFDNDVWDAGRGEHIVFESFLVFPMVGEVMVVVEVFF